MENSSIINPTARDITRAQNDPAQIVGHIGDTYWSRLPLNTCPRTGESFGSTMELVLFIENEFGIALFNSWLISEPGVQAIATLKAQKAREDMLEQQRLLLVQQQQQTQSVLADSLPLPAVNGHPLHLELTRQPATSGDTPCYQVGGGSGVKMSNNKRWGEAFPADLALFLEGHPEGWLFNFWTLAPS